MNALLTTLVESLLEQERSVALNQRFGSALVERAASHCEIIRRFGRFPHRNAISGRPSSEAELKFLKNGGFAG